MRPGDQAIPPSAKLKNGCDPTDNAEEKNGRSERIRTSDPLVPNEVRYQAALHSD